jgi:ribosomal protein L33
VQSAWSPTLDSHQPVGTSTLPRNPTVTHIHAHTFSYGELVEMGDQASRDTISDDQCAQAAADFVEAARHARDIAPAISTESTVDDDDSFVNLDTQDVEWHENFHPAAHSSAPASANPALSQITLLDDASHTRRSAYIDCLTSYDCLIGKLIEEELRGSRALQGTGVIPLKTICRQVLFCMDTRVVHAIIRGDLPRRFVCDSDIRKVLDALWRSQIPPGGSRQRSVQPAIYVQYLVDEHGRGLSAAQRMTLAQCLLDYCEGKDPEFALAVDSRRVQRSDIATLRRSQNGYRKYLTTKGVSSNEQRVEHLRTFCNALKQHTLSHSEDASSHPLCEVGYSKRCHYRLQQHRCHTSSNWLMNLIEAICEEAFHSQFHLAQFVVARLFAPAQASVAEILVTRLAEGTFIRVWRELLATSMFSMAAFAMS